MNPVPRTAILAPGFADSKLARVFPEGWSEEAARFEPTSIAGPVKELRKVARLGIELRHAVVVFIHDDDNRLSNGDREFFWKSFGVPVFEQQLGPSNELLAMECDAHAGLHLVGEFDRLGRDKNSCDCGSPAPRLTRRPRIEELADLLA